MVELASGKEAHGADNVADEQVSDDAFILLVNEERVTEDAAALQGSVSGEDLGVHVAQDHLGGAGVVPGEKLGPNRNLIFEQRPKISRRKMTEIEDFHEAPAGGDAECPSRSCLPYTANRELL